MNMIIANGSTVDIVAGKLIKVKHGYLPESADGLFFEVINISSNMPVIQFNGEEPCVSPEIIEEVI